MGRVLPTAPHQPTAHQTGFRGDDDERRKVFSDFYAIDLGDGQRDNPTRSTSHRNKVRGLVSPWGQRGEICAHFGWTYDYLLRGIAWINVQLMMADGPKMNTDTEDKTDKPQNKEKAKKNDVQRFFESRNAALRKKRK